MKRERPQRRSRPIHHCQSLRSYATGFARWPTTQCSSYGLKPYCGPSSFIIHKSQLVMRSCTASVFSASSAILQRSRIADAMALRAPRWRGAHPQPTLRLAVHVGISTVSHEGEMLLWAQIHGSCINTVYLSVWLSQTRGLLENGHRQSLGVTSNQ